MPDIDSLWDNDDTEQFHFTEEERSPDYSKLINKINEEVETKVEGKYIRPEYRTEFNLSDLSDDVPKLLSEQDIKQIARVQRFRKE